MAQGVRAREKSDKPVKKHKDGWTGKRDKNNKLRAKKLAKKKQEKSWTWKKQHQFLDRGSKSYQNLKNTLLKKFLKSGILNSKEPFE